MNGLYLIGEPGAGKSSVMRALTDVWSFRTRHDKPFAHVRYRDEDNRTVAAQLGAEDRKFPGTDRLSMSVQPRAIEWLQGAPAPVVLGEGDRLASQGFFEALEATTDAWALFAIEVPEDLAAERRGERGSEQSEAWLKGRRTKLANLRKQWAHRICYVDNQGTPNEAAEQIRQHFFRLTGVGLGFF